MNRGQFDPVAVGLEAPLDLRRIDADVVVVIGPPQGVYAVWPQGHTVSCLGSRAPQCRLDTDRPAVERGGVGHFHIPAWHTGIRAHGAAVFLGCLIVFQHRLQHEGREIAILDVGLRSQTIEVIVGNLDRRPCPSGPVLCVLQHRSKSSSALHLGCRRCRLFVADQGLAWPDNREVNRHAIRFQCGAIHLHGRENTTRRGLRRRGNPRENARLLNSRAPAPPWQSPRSFPPGC